MKALWTSSIGSRNIQKMRSQFNQATTSYLNQLAGKLCHEACTLDAPSKWAANLRSTAEVGTVKTISKSDFTLQNASIISTVSLLVRKWTIINECAHVISFRLSYIEIIVFALMFSTHVQTKAHADVIRPARLRRTPIPTLEHESPPQCITYHTAGRPKTRYWQSVCESDESTIMQPCTPAWQSITVTLPSFHRHCCVLLGVPCP